MSVSPIERLAAFLRSMLGILVLFPGMTVVLCFAILLNAFSINSKSFADWVIDIWSRGACWIFGVELKITGQENLPSSGCLYLFNHTSFFDIFVMYVLDPSLRFGAKIELFRIPLFGYAMRKTGTLPIPRDNVQEAIRVYEDATERARAGQRFALSPEGGRNEGSSHLKSFKSGPFVFALNCHMDLVPVIIKGAESVWPKGAFLPGWKRWKHRIEIRVLKTVSIDKYSLENRGQLKDFVYQEMNQALRQV